MESTVKNNLLSWAIVLAATMVWGAALLLSLLLGKVSSLFTAPGVIVLILIFAAVAFLEKRHGE